MNQVSKNFKWKDKTGKFHNPQDMETRHLFYTVRMIWNHVVPESYKLQPYRQYYFGEFYTDEYMTEAIKILCRELNKRKDMEESWKCDLDFMKSKFTPIQLDCVL